LLDTLVEGFVGIAQRMLFYRCLSSSALLHDGMKVVVLTPPRVDAEQHHSAAVLQASTLAETDWKWPVPS